MSLMRYELTVNLRTLSPLHSGGVDEVADPSRTGADRVAVARKFARDAHGRPVLTGRSVKGALRAACERFLQDCEVRKDDKPLAGIGNLLDCPRESLWGDRGQSRKDAAPVRASALTCKPVYLPEVRQPGAKAQGEEAPGLPTRMGNAIDRFWGAVGDGALFSHEYLPAGSRLTLVVKAEAGLPDGVKGQPGAEPPQREEVEQLLGLILGLLKGGHVAFGARQGAGWGLVALDDEQGDKAWSMRCYDPTSRKGLQALLDGDAAQPASLDVVNCAKSDPMRVKITWDSPTGILVAEPAVAPDAASQGANEDAKQVHAKTSGKEQQETQPARPLRSGPSDKDVLVLPGSSVRGALRTRATRIARTVLAAREGAKLDSWADNSVGVHDQLARDPLLVRCLFGTTEIRGAVRVLDTLAANEVQGRKVTHNAGDRWTGGVAEGALYSEMVHDVDWNQIVLEVDTDRLLQNCDIALKTSRQPAPQDTNNMARAAWCLLGLVLAELATGSLPLGSRGTRGMGQVNVTGIVITGADVLGEPTWQAKAPEHSGRGDEEAEAGATVAEQVLSHLRAVNEVVQQSPDSAEGWSAYLLTDTESHNE